MLRYDCTVCAPHVVGSSVFANRCRKVATTVLNTSLETKVVGVVRLEFENLFGFQGGVANCGLDSASALRMEF